MNLATFRDNNSTTHQSMFYHPSNTSNHKNLVASSREQSHNLKINEHVLHDNQIKNNIQNKYRKRNIIVKNDHLNQEENENITKLEHIKADQNHVNDLNSAEEHSQVSEHKNLPRALHSVYYSHGSATHDKFSD